MICHFLSTSQDEVALSQHMCTVQLLIVNILKAALAQATQTAINIF